MQRCLSPDRIKKREGVREKEREGEKGEERETHLDFLVICGSPCQFWKESPRKYFSV